MLNSLLQLHNRLFSELSLASGPRPIASTSVCKACVPLAADTLAIMGDAVDLQVLTALKHAAKTLESAASPTASSH